MIRIGGKPKPVLREDPDVILTVQNYQEVAARLAAFMEGHQVTIKVGGKEYTNLLPTIKALLYPDNGPSVRIDVYPCGSEDWVIPISSIKDEGLKKIWSPSDYSRLSFFDNMVIIQTRSMQVTITRT